MSSITQSLKTFLASYDGLPTRAEVTTNELTGKIGSFSLSPLPGARVVTEYLDGTKIKEFPFVLSSVECTADEASRLQSSGFYETFSEWLEDCSDGDLATLLPLGGNRVATSIEATTFGYLLSRGPDAATAVYQINCKLTYEQKG